MRNVQRLEWKDGKGEARQRNADTCRVIGAGTMNVCRIGLLTGVFTVVLAFVLILMAFSGIQDGWYSVPLLCLLGVSGLGTIVIGQTSCPELRGGYRILWKTARGVRLERRDRVVGNLTDTTVNTFVFTSLLAVAAAYAYFLSNGVDTSSFGWFHIVFGLYFVDLCIGFGRMFIRVPGGVLYFLRRRELTMDDIDLTGIGQWNIEQSRTGNQEERGGDGRVEDPADG